MASPKHPQSISGLKMTRRRVRSVKKLCSAMAHWATARRHTPVMSAVPMTVSARAKKTPMNFAENPRKPRWRNA